MAYDTWGGSWGTSWATSWTRSTPAPATNTGAGPGWQLFHVDTGKRWKKERKSREELRRMLERAIAKALGRDDPKAEAIVAEHSNRKTDTDARPEVVAAQVNYTELLQDVAAVEYLLGLYYKKRVQIESDDDDDLLLMTS